MIVENPNISKLAWQETLSGVKLTSPVTIILSLGSAFATIGVTYIFTNSLAISALCSLALLAMTTVGLFTVKLFTVPRRLLLAEMTKTAELTASANIMEAAPLAQHDVELFRKFTLLITESDINFFKCHHFGDHIPKKSLYHMREFFEVWDKPQHEFISPEMNARFREVKKAVEELSNRVMAYTMTSDLRPECLTVLHDGDPYGVSERTQAEVKEMNEAATHFVEMVTEFHRYALDRGFLFG